jgi:hypothetical protein
MIGLVVVVSLAVTTDVLVAQSSPTRPVTLRGHVRTSIGTPLKADISAIQGSPHRSMSNYVTRDDGYFEITVEAGSVTLMVKADEFFPETRTLEVTTDAQVNFVLSPPTTISGIVVTPLGQAVSNARVRALYPDVPEGPRFTQEVGNMSTDSFGTFTLPFVKTHSRVILEVEAPGYALTYSPVINVAGVSLTAVRVELSRGATIRGDVVDDRGRPVVDAVVVIRAAGGQAQAPRQPGSLTKLTKRTSSSGAFAFDSLVEGAYDVIVRSPQHPPFVQRVTVSAGQELVLRISFSAR